MDHSQKRSEDVDREVAVDLRRKPEEQDLRDSEDPYERDQIEQAAIFVHGRHSFHQVRILCPHAGQKVDDAGIDALHDGQITVWEAVWAAVCPIKPARCGCIAEAYWL